MTEWEECIAKLESSWGTGFPDAKQTLKCPNDGTKELKLSLMANGTSADADAMPSHKKVEAKMCRSDKTKSYKES